MTRGRAQRDPNTRVGPRSSATRRQPRPVAIDLDKLRERLRVIGDEQRFYILNEAIEILPEPALVQIVGRYLQLGDLRPDPEMSKQSLLDEVKRFDAAARAGHYYESFNVNSKNCMDKSAGTVAFIANFTRLLDRSVTASGNSDRAEVRTVMETLFALHRYIAECNDDVIFFADEGGAWQICVDWLTVLPAWFRCLARTADALEFARLVDETIEEFDPQSRSTHLATAGRIATAPQRRELTARGSSKAVRV